MYRIVSFNVCAIGDFAFSKVFFFVLIYEIVYSKSWDMAFSSSWEGMPPDSLGYQLVTFLIHAYYIKLYTQPCSQGLSSLSSSHPLELQGVGRRENLGTRLLYIMLLISVQFLEGGPFF